MLKDEARVEEVNEFLDEIKLYGQLCFAGGVADMEGSRNILKLIGASVDCLPYMRTFEDCTAGDLKTFLINGGGKN